MYRKINFLKLQSIIYFFNSCFSSHPDLTNTVCRKAGVKSGNVVLKKFANNETMVELNENVRVGLHCYHLYRKHSGNYIHEIHILITKYLFSFQGQNIFIIQTAGIGNPNDHIMVLSKSLTCAITYVLHRYLCLIYLIQCICKIYFYGIFQELLLLVSACR